MSPFRYQARGFPVRANVVEAHRNVWASVGRAGSWWTGAERVAIAAQARAARAQRAKPPWLREFPGQAGELPAAAIEAARMIAADASKIDRDWAGKRIAALGDAAYVELAAVTACVCAIDAFADALGIPCEPLPPAERAGEPDRARNESVEDAGAYVPLQAPWGAPNVGRAFSLVPEQNGMFMGLVMPMYGGNPGQSFFELVWDGPLSRPQVELLAARVSAVNECFY